MAEFGTLPYADIEYRTGASGGGFDKMRFRIPDPADYLDISDEDIVLSLEINRRGDGRPNRCCRCPATAAACPSVRALHPMLGRARAAKRLNILTCTGEGGYPAEPFTRMTEHVITQVATGLFGCGRTPSSARRWWSSNMPRAPSRGWAATSWGTRSPRGGPPCASR